jgi:curved DNA-binding protein CbpA
VTLREHGEVDVNYYDVIGVSPAASPEAINAAHKALAKMYHPDINSSEDAHEKMAMLNEANDVLSDTKKREKYDSELRRTQQLSQNQEISASQGADAKQPRGTIDADERAGRAEMLRRKAEARLKTEEAARKQRTQQAQQKAEEAARKNRQVKADFDRQDVVNGLAALVMGDNKKRHRKMDVDEERYYATKVLLSMVRADDKHLRRVAEEAERKQRIEEILSLVKEHNDKKEWI